MTDLKPGMIIAVTTVFAAMPAMPAPGNEYQPDFSLRCLDHDYRGYECEATKGHSGDHMPYASNGRLVTTPWRNTSDPAGYTPPDAGDRPLHLPAGAEWPPPAGKRIMYRYGQISGGCICSDCIRDPSRARGTQERYPYTLVQVGRTKNQNWSCTSYAWDTSGSYPRAVRTNCSKYGSRLT